MAQVYLLEELYLFLSAMMLLGDQYGAQLPILLSLRYAFRRVAWVRHLFFWGGFSLGIISLFVPYAPGPRLLGDLVVTLTLFPLCAWYAFLTRSQNHGEGGGALANHIEKHKKGWGIAVLGVALIHFLFPMLVLL